MFIGFADAILRSKILDNRVNILTQVLITMDYFFYLHILDIHLQFRGKKLVWAINFIMKSIRKRTEILAKSLFTFSIIVFNMKFLVILFTRKSISRENCLVQCIQVTGSTYCGLCICDLLSTNYVYVKDMYLSLNGIGKILFVSVLRILLICRTLNFTATSTNKI